jgi:hypothetical protein
MDESARRAVHRTLRDARSKPRRACHASSSSARMASARAMRSPGSVIRRGEGAACCAEESLERAAFWGADRGASYKGLRRRPRFWAAPVWTAAASAKLGKCDRGSAPEVGSLESPTGLFDPWPLPCIARPTSQRGLFKAYTMLGVQNRGCNLLQCGSGKRAREHKQGWRVTTLLAGDFRKSVIMEASCRAC